MPTTFRKGDTVHVDPQQFPPPGVAGRTFTVERVNPKNVVCAATDGGRGINYPATMLVPGPAPTPVSVPYVPMTLFGIGEVVTLRTPFKGEIADLPYVVVKDNGDTKVNVARLGNTSGQYLRASRTGLVRRDLAWLAVHLPEVGATPAAV